MTSGRDFRDFPDELFWSLKKKQNVKINSTIILKTASCVFSKLFWRSCFFIFLIEIKNLDRYRRGLETCPQAKMSKSWHAIFFSFSDASERQVRLSGESKILASIFGRFRVYRLMILDHRYSSYRKVDQKCGSEPKNTLTSKEFLSDSGHLT